jgi:hypothetical protein
MMRNAMLTLTLALVPGALAGQETAHSQSESRTTAGISVETRTRVEAMIRAAERDGLPSEAMADRAAEGQAKRAPDAAILAAVARTRAELDASLAALHRGGREQPEREEVTRGAQVLARGATEAQLEAIVRRTPSERRLSVALDVLTDLTARGMPVEHALAVVGSRLEAGASDGQLTALTTSANSQLNGNAGLGLGAEPGAISVTKSVTGAAGIGLGRRP